MSLKKTNKKDLFKQNVTQDIHTLFENDKLLNKKILELADLQNKKKITKEISVTDSGVYIHSKQALKDLDKILSNDKVKNFFDICRKNQITKGVSYAG